MKTDNEKLPMRPNVREKTGPEFESNPKSFGTDDVPLATASIEAKSPQKQCVTLHYVLHALKRP